jgi:hypothetical protein
MKSWNKQENFLNMMKRIWGRLLRMNQQTDEWTVKIIELQRCCILEYIMRHNSF